MSHSGIVRSILFCAVFLATAQYWGACSDPRFITRTPPGQQVDVFQQTSVPNLDVLWVVDNSDSMVEEQRALADNFGDFYAYLESTGADYHIGVISSDVYSSDHQGRLLGEISFITPETPDSDEVFAENVNVGVGGKGDEQGFHAAILALTEPMISGDNKDFIREDAHLFVIFVSDEDDSSFGEVRYYLRRFEQLKGLGNDGMVKVAAVVGDVPEVPDWCRNEKNVRPGERYAELAVSSGGMVLSICDDDFGSNLDQLGFSAAGLRRHFTLSRLALPASIEVWVKTSCGTALPEEVCEEYYDDCTDPDSDVYGQTCVPRRSLPDGWAYEQDSNSIRFFGAAVPPFGAIVEVGYIPDEEFY